MSAPLLDYSHVNTTDPSLTDEELIAIFTPKQMGFYQWYTQAEESGEVDLHDDRLWRARIRQQFPNTEERHEFLHWMQMWSGRFRRRMGREMPVDAFFDLIEKTKFNDLESAGTFL